MNQSPITGHTRTSRRPHNRAQQNIKSIESNEPNQLGHKHICTTTCQAIAASKRTPQQGLYTPNSNKNVGQQATKPANNTTSRTQKQTSNPAATCRISRPTQPSCRTQSYHFYIC
ncbi:hypothetical protein BDE02_01G343400 [Populus trichocarpa]|nr:hypothetical protein BDE02_01G343400 [Populus trichocarpa]